MKKDFEQYRPYIFHLIRKIKSWGYNFSMEDIEDLLQASYLAIWEARKANEKTILQHVSSRLYKEFHSIKRKGKKFKPNIVLSPSTEPFIRDIKSDSKNPLNKIIQEEEFRKKDALLRDILIEEELKTLSKIADKKEIISLNIPHHNFSDIKKKLNYLRIFEDSTLSPIERETAKVYLEVLLGARSRFPRDFGDKNSPFLVRYLFDNILEQDPTSIDKSYIKLFKKYKIGGVTKEGIIKILKKAYPEKAPWNFRNVRWTNEMLFSAIEYIVLQEGLSMEKLTRTHLSKYKRIESAVHNKFGGLSNLLKHNLSIGDRALAKIEGKWSGPESDKYAHIAMDNLINKLREDHNVEIDNIPGFFKRLGNNRTNRGRNKIFEQYGLSTMLLYKFNWSVYRAFDFHLPKRFHSWEFSNQLLFKNLKTIKEKKKRAAKATKWLIEDKLGFENPREIINYRKIDIIKKMRENGIGGVGAYFHNSLYKIFNNAYSGLFESSDFRHKKKVLTNTQQTVMRTEH